MEKSNSKRKVRSSSSQAMSASELRVPGFGEKRVMTDAEAAEFRQRLISAGTVTPTENTEQTMSAEAIAAYKKSLIEQGLLSPGTGLAKLKAAQERRAKAAKARKNTEMH